MFHVLILLIVCFSTEKLPEGKDFSVLFIVVSLGPREQCLKHSKLSINIYCSVGRHHGVYIVYLFSNLEPALRNITEDNHY